MTHTETSYLLINQKLSLILIFHCSLVIDPSLVQVIHQNDEWRKNGIIISGTISETYTTSKNTLNSNTLCY